MTRQEIAFQPGPVLHEAIMGGLRAKGTTLADWCRDEGITQTVARQATFGQTRGESSQKLLARLIDAAGAEYVRHVYDYRTLAHAEEIRRRAV